MSIQEQLLVAQLSSLLQAARKQPELAHVGKPGLEERWLQADTSASTAGLWLTQLLASCQQGSAAAVQPAWQQQQQQRQQGMNPDAPAGPRSTLPAWPYHNPPPALQRAELQGLWAPPKRVELLSMVQLERSRALRGQQCGPGRSEAGGPCGSGAQQHQSSSLTLQQVLCGSQDLLQQGGSCGSLPAPQRQPPGPSPGAVVWQQHQQRLGGYAEGEPWPGASALLSEGLPLSYAEKLQLAVAAQRHLGCGSGSDQRSAVVQPPPMLPPARSLASQPGSASLMQPRVEAVAAPPAAAARPPQAPAEAASALTTRKNSLHSSLPPAVPPAAAASTPKASLGAVPQRVLLTELLSRAVRQALPPPPPPQPQQPQQQPLGSSLGSGGGAVAASDSTPHTQGIAATATGTTLPANGGQLPGPAPEQRAQRQQRLQHHRRWQSMGKITPEFQRSLKPLLLQRRQAMEEVFEEAGFTPPLDSERKSTPFSRSRPSGISPTEAGPAPVSSLTNVPKPPFATVPARSSHSLPLDQSFGATASGCGGAATQENSHSDPSPVEQPTMPQQQRRPAQQLQQQPPPGPPPSPFDNAPAEAGGAVPWPSAPAPYHRGAGTTLAPAMGSSSVAFAEALGSPRPAAEQCPEAAGPAGAAGIGDSPGSAALEIGASAAAREEHVPPEGGAQALQPLPLLQRRGSNSSSGRGKDGASGGMRSQGGSGRGLSTFSSSGSMVPNVSDALAALASAARAARADALKGLVLGECEGPGVTQIEAAAAVMLSPWELLSSTARGDAHAGACPPSAPNGTSAPPAVGPHPTPLLIRSQPVPPPPQQQQLPLQSNGSPQGTASLPSQGRSPAALQQQGMLPQQAGLPHKQEVESSLGNAGVSWCPPPQQQPVAAPPLQPGQQQQGWVLGALGGPANPLGQTAQQAQLGDSLVAAAELLLGVHRQLAPSIPPPPWQLPPQQQQRRAPPLPASVFASALVGQPHLQQPGQQQAYGSSGGVEGSISGNCSLALLSQITSTILQQLSQPGHAPLGSAFLTDTASLHQQRQWQLPPPPQQRQQAQHIPAALFLARELALRGAVRFPAGTPGASAAAMRLAALTSPADEAFGGAGPFGGQPLAHPWGAAGSGGGCEGSPAIGGQHPDGGLKRQEPDWPEFDPRNASPSAAKRRRSGRGAQ